MYGNASLNLDHMYVFMYVHMAVLVFLKVAQAGEQTRDLWISFIFSFHHFTAGPKRLPYGCSCL
jgi:hypothetical protein